MHRLPDLRKATSATHLIQGHIIYLDRHTIISHTAEQLSPSYANHKVTSYKLNFLNRSINQSPDVS